MGEWWHIGQMLQAEHTVLLYERAGYGSSERSEAQRSPAKIAEELMDLLDAVPHEDSVIMIAHSQGGLYAQQFARLYPQRVRALVLLDPLSASDSRYKQVLSPAEQKHSGFDKTKSLALLHTLARLRLGFAIKALMKNAPPFYYYRDFSPEAAQSILRAWAEPDLYAAALEEYRLAHLEENTRPLREAAGFPGVPLALITHSSEFAQAEIVEFGRASPQLAQRVEALWQSLMGEYLGFGSVQRQWRAKNSGHYLHLTEPELIDEALWWVDEVSPPSC